MKWFYWIPIAIITIIFLYIVKYLPLPASALATIGSTFVALGTAVIAISIANKPPRFVKFMVKKKGLDNKDTNRPDRFKDFPRRNEEKFNFLNAPFCTYRVHFVLKNKSKSSPERALIFIVFNPKSIRIF